MGPLIICGILLSTIPGSLSTATLQKPSKFIEYHPKFRIDRKSEWASPSLINSLGQNFSLLYAIYDDALEYTCNINNPVTSLYQEQPENDSIELIKQKVNAINAVKRFNEQHKNQCIYREFGYWSYRICFQGDITQFHYSGDRMKVHEQLAVKNSKIPYHRLGLMKEGSYSKSSDFEFVKSNDGSRYLSQLVYNGSTCDITGQPRSIYVQYKCDQNRIIPFIETVEELKTCEYRMVVLSAELCQYSVLQPEIYATEGNITCYPVKKEYISDDDLVEHEKLDLSALSLQPVGYGIFYGTFKDQKLQARPNILVSNRNYEIITDHINLTSSDVGDDNNMQVTIDTNSLLGDVMNAFINMVGTHAINSPDGLKGTRAIRQGDKFMYVTEVYGLNREFIANVAFNQTDDNLILAYYIDYGTIKDNFVFFESALSPSSTETQEVMSSQPTKLI